ncbi:MAG TPA: M1 family metallopeptidase [Thermoanaerobaculia bacterium]
MNRPTPRPLLLLVLLALAAGCATAPATAPPPPAAAAEPAAAPGVGAVDDAHSYAEPWKVAVRHLALDLAVDFDRQVLSGHADLTLDRRDPAADSLVLDSRGLTVRRVTLDGGAEAEFEVGDADPVLGAPLTIGIAPDTEVVRVEYETSPDAAALQWLSPAQTAGGEHPFLFSQCQAILCRTIIPLQDTPSVRFTYEATLRVPPELLAVMSAENPTAKNATGVYRFEMPQAIPSYLLALAVGDLAFRSMGPRTGVYAEPSVVDAAAHEFAETEQMVEAAERLYGPYRWGRYDLLVLPPSFPFGGMENPRLTFATPTILAGDRSLVALVAHELGHSWSGNLVTNATWDDFWLNEGFTVYVERRLMEELRGREYSEMLATLARQEVEATIADLGPDSRDTHLHLDLAGRDPDEGMTDIAYEKGYLFLRALEEAVGRDRWDPFLRGWFERHAFEPATSELFLAEVRERLLQPAGIAPETVGLERWVYGPGLPPNAPEPRTAAFAEVEAELASWLAGEAAAADLATADWTTHEWLHFLRALPAELTAEQLAELDRAFGFTASGNSEVLSAWLLVAIANDYRAADRALEDFLMEVGRRKFLDPLYRALAATPEGRQRALAIYRRARPGYHSVSVGTIDEILGWEG